MPLRVYNTLSRTKEPFQPVDPEGRRVKIYVCGPTVYMPSHVGHMVGPVIFDTVKRYLEYLGYEVTLVINITDVEDKLIERARTEGTTVVELARRVTEDYLDNLKKLGVESIDAMPRATEHIDEIIRITQGLIEKGYAYVSDGDVYFEVSKDDDYGKLSRRNPEELQAGVRVELSTRKRHPLDFALWKSAKPGEPAWDSPWGQGRPGWHIECSAMSMKYLGEHFDVHGGGLDLVFPHHENEVAQSECFTGKPFAKYWMHNGLMQLTGDKMSKSKGNLVMASELLERYRPEVIRFFLLSTHYRRPIDFSDDHLQEADKAVEHFYRFFERYERIIGERFYDLPRPTRLRDEPLKGEPTGFFQELNEHRRHFFEAMDDDFNTAAAMAALHEMLSSLNRFIDVHEMEATGKGNKALQESLQKGAMLLRELGSLLGLFLKPPEAPRRPIDDVAEKLVALFVEVRARARSQKNFALADYVREELGKLGITLEDLPDGTIWRWSGG